MTRPEPPKRVSVGYHREHPSAERLQAPESVPPRQTMPTPVELHVHTERQRSDPTRGSWHSQLRGRAPWLVPLLSAVLAALGGGGISLVTERPDRSHEVLDAVKPVASAQTKSLGELHGYLLARDEAFDKRLDAIEAELLAQKELLAKYKIKPKKPEPVSAPVSARVVPPPPPSVPKLPAELPER